MNQLIFCCLFSFASQIMSSTASLLPLTRIQQIEKFFPEFDGNLTSVTWDHAVNSLELLHKSLQSNIMMIEADIVMGRLNDNPEVIPIMAHPPNDTSDLSLEMFLTKVKNFNEEGKPNSKGVKLDFKTTEAFNHSTKIIEELHNEMHFPVWLNADILRGPVNANDEPVDPNVFIRGSKAFKNAVLSLGWRTNYGNGIENASYSAANIIEMKFAIYSNTIGEKVPSITFPVRAGIAAQSNEQLLDLLTKVQNSTLTIWGSEDDKVDVESLRMLIKDATVEKVYVDVPKSLLDKLRLHELNAGISFKPFAVLTAVVAALLLTLF